MTTQILNKPLEEISSDALIVFAFQKEKGNKSEYVPTKAFTHINNVLHDQLKKAASFEKFTGEKGSLFSLFTNDDILASKIICIGLGKKEEITIDDFRQNIGKYVSLSHKKIDSLTISIPENIQDSEVLMHAAIEGVELATYGFAKYKEKKVTDRQFQSLILVTEDKITEKKVNDIIENAQYYSHATQLARDLVNEQPSVATPTFLAELAKDIAQSSDQVSVKIFDKPQLEKMGMHAFLGIARASDTPPKFIFLEYTPKNYKGKEKIALVGKGITFDSGGVNVKPGDHMSDMKMDMAGAALVLGVFSVIAKIKPSIPVMGVIAATPNLISSSAIVPGDVVKAYNGKTIEVLNTDAEGRVTLADSLSYAVEQGATHIIDFATLTGACIVALGEDIAGLFVNDKEFGDSIKKSADITGEKMWELPLEKSYKKMNDSDVADIANIPNTRWAGTISAALFLEEFIGKTKWAHLDIAGPAFASRNSALGPKGGTGYGVRTVLQLLEGEKI